MDKEKVKTGVVRVFPQKRIFFYTLPAGKFDTRMCALFGSSF
jgi:hypothetical protein